MSNESAVPGVLRSAAAWLEAHPEVSPYEISLSRFRWGDGPACIVVFPHTAERMAELARLIGGRWEKDYIGEMFDMRQRVAPDLEIEMSANRDAVCERVQTGTRTVEIPDPELVADVPMVTVEEPVYEWRCEPLLAGAVDS